MKVTIPFEFTDADRRSIARFLGHDLPARHIECVAWARHQVRSTLELMAQVTPSPTGVLPPINNQSPIKVQGVVGE